jgi:ribosome-associated protein
LKSLRVGAVTIPAADLSMRAVRAQGPGGQNVNKVASKVELRLDLAATAALEPAVKARLARLARVASSGALVVTSQAHRDQGRNLEDARAKLAALVARALVVPRRRVATKPTAGARERRLTGKRRRATIKKERGGWD